jgi:phosphatidylglycerophosphate synthase
MTRSMKASVDETASRAHAAVMLLAAAASLALGNALPAALAGGAALLVLVHAHRGRFTPSGQFGAANAITALRLLLTLSLGWLGLRTLEAPVALLVLAIFALDGLDGWLARRSGQASDFGARFDMECDALLVLVCALLLYLHGRLGAFVLVAGALRYAYVLVLAVLPQGGREAPRSRLGRYVFAVLMLSFIASLALLPGHRWLALGAVLLLCVSFARSMYWSVRRV